MQKIGFQGIIRGTVPLPPYGKVNIPDDGYRLRNVEYSNSDFYTRYPNQASPGDIFITKQKQDKPHEALIVISCDNIANDYGKKTVYNPLTGKTKEITNSWLENNVDSVKQLNAEL